MSEDEKTLYVNGEETDVSNEQKNEATEYVGKHAEEDAGSAESTLYVGKEGAETVAENRTDAVESSDRGETDASHMEDESGDTMTPEIVSGMDDNGSKIDSGEGITAKTADQHDSGQIAEQDLSPDEEESGSYYLPSNTILQKRYRIDSVIGEGGFGITYSGWDITLNIPVAIKEYYPSGLVTRSATLGKTTQVVPIAQSKYGNQFRDGIDHVLDEARRTAKFRNIPGIVGVYDFFEANNTAYIVLEYIDGCTIDVYYKNHRVDNTTLFNMLVPVMDALQALHNEGIIHRDISPDNIMVDKDGNYKLLDFGAARGFSEDSSTTMSIILKKSYAPEEQYRSKGNQGPWTDVYALGATIYDLITGQTPPNSIDRLVEDEIIDIRKIAPSLTKGEAEAIMKALAVRSKDRWDSVERFKTALLGESSPRMSHGVDSSGGSDGSETAPAKKVLTGKRLPVLLLAVPLLIILLLVLAFLISNKLRLGPEKHEMTGEMSAADNAADDSIRDLDDTNSEQSQSEQKQEQAALTQDAQDGTGNTDQKNLDEFVGRHPGYLGIVSKANYSTQEGCCIAEVQKNTPAENAGLVNGDILTRIDDFSIDSQTTFSEVMRNYWADDEIIITYLHPEGDQYNEATCEVKLADRHDFVRKGSALIGVDSSDVPEVVTDKRGVDSGAYISKVREGYPADEAGMRIGDIITGINDITVTSDKDLSNAMKEFYSGDLMAITYLRMDKTAYAERKAYVYAADRDNMSSTNDALANLNALLQAFPSTNNTSRSSIPENAIEIDLVGIKKSYATNYYDVYLSIKNNTSSDIVKFFHKGLFFNNTQVDDLQSIGTIPASSVATYTLQAKMPDLILEAVGDTINEVRMDYYCDGVSSLHPISVYDTDCKCPIADSASQNKDKSKDAKEEKAVQYTVDERNDKIQAPNDLEIELTKIEEIEKFVDFDFLVHNNGDTTQKFNVPEKESYFNDIQVICKGGDSWVKILPGKTNPIHLYVPKSAFQSANISSLNSADIGMKIKVDDKEYNEVRFPISNISMDIKY